MSAKKLSDWAKEHGVHYRTAMVWLHEGKLPVQVSRTPGGHYRVNELARFGVEYIEAALQAQCRSLVVAEASEQKLDLVQDFIDVVTSMCARIYGRRAASNRAKKALAAAQEEP
jgi:predicted site-specific integrase-resolvase